MIALTFCLSFILLRHLQIDMTPKNRSHILSVGDVLVSSEVIDTYFCCDLEACKGACCIEGESGAPILDQEQDLVCNAFPLIEPYLDEESLKYIEETGLMYTDMDGDLVTNIIDGGRCVFTCFEGDGSCRCAFEKAYSEEKNEIFYKPISCHLYPIRMSQVGDSIALNYHRWAPICEPARAQGEKLGVRLYQFVKEPLIRAFGEEWYEELEAVAQQYLEERDNSHE